MTRIRIRQCVMMTVGLGLAAIPSQGSQGVGALGGPVTLADETVYQVEATADQREAHVLRRAHRAASWHVVALTRP